MMKKMFFFLFAIGMMVTVQAQQALEPGRVYTGQQVLQLAAVNSWVLQGIDPAGMYTYDVYTNNFRKYCPNCPTLPPQQPPVQPYQLPYQPPQPSTPQIIYVQVPQQTSPHQIVIERDGAAKFRDVGMGVGFIGMGAGAVLSGTGDLMYGNAARNGLLQPVSYQNNSFHFTNTVSPTPNGPQMWPTIPSQNGGGAVIVENDPLWNPGNNNPGLNTSGRPVMGGTIYEYHGGF